MRREFEHYLDNLEAARALIKPCYPNDLDKDALIRAVRENAQKQAAIKAENDAILGNQELGIYSAPEDLTSSQAQDLREFSSRLSSFLLQLDNPLCYRIHKLLFQYEKLHGHLDHQIREAYYCGLTLFYLNRSSREFHTYLFNEEIASYFSFAGNYIYHLEDFSNPETQSYIIRSFANIKLSYSADFSTPESRYHSIRMDYFHKRVEHVQLELALFSDPVIREKAPSFNWDAALYAVHFGVTNLLTYLRTHSDPKLAKLTYDSSMYIWQHSGLAEQDNHRLLKPKVAYVYHASRFEMGIAPIDELLDFFYGRVTDADLTLYDSDHIFDNLTCVSYFQWYMQAHCPDSPLRQRQAKELRAHMNLYLKHMPVNEYFSFATEQFANNIFLFGNPSIIDSHLLQLFLMFHRPTFVHSLMVAKLTEALFRELYRTTPSLVLSALDLPEASVTAESMSGYFQKAYMMGLYHDLGKIIVMDYVNQYARRLFPEEFELIKAHSYNGYVLLHFFDAGGDYAQAALGHHRYYDGSAGYPDYYERTDDLTQVIIDILSVADSLDAATDNVGRCYAHGISFSQLVQELFDGSGTRYAPYVTDLFRNPDFYRYLDEHLSGWRQDAYYEAYLSSATEDTLSF